MSKSLDERTPTASGHQLMDRRGFLVRGGSGLGAIALTHLLQLQGLIASPRERESAPGKTPIRPEIDPAHPHAPRRPHFAPRARNVIVVFCSGAISHLDTFDYKPELVRRHGSPLPGGDKLVTFQGQQGNLTRSPWKFKPRVDY